ncbi:MAG TPA: DinB family protein [Dehalococcoidia bacterium]|nr:DinB family protein [Dehalococcoidia bacterium]
METSDFVLDTLEQVQNAVTTAVKGLSHEELTWRPGDEANSIGFILWHQIRAEDVLLHDWIQQKPQVWVTEKWHLKLKLPEEPHDDGWGYTADQVAAFPVPELKDLMGYAEATRAQTTNYLKSTTADKLDEKIQTPMGEYTIGQTIAILLCEIIQHTGQIAYLRGLQRGLDK